LAGQSTIELLQSVTYLNGLASPTIEALARVAKVQTFATGEAIFWEGEPVAGLFVVGDGCVKICRHSTEGREHILHLLYRGDTFNDVAALDGGPNPATALAHSDAQVLFIARSDLMRIAEQHPQLSWVLLERLAKRVRYLVTVVEGLSMRSVKGRLAHLLLQQSEQEGSLHLSRILTQEEMANRLGTVREMVGRALRNLADDGIIEFNRHSITILDPERLAEEAAA
jgi:CRP/FNR family transcriptional regulator, cyclic AMP receptor protein